MEAETLVDTYQRSLFALAYRMTGEVAVSEDIVQETLANWTMANNSTVQYLRAYLRRAVVNRSLNHLATVKRQREAYKGIWLPEPIVSREIDQVDAEIDLSYGLMLLLETMTPPERAVLLLKESFDISYAEIADMLNLTQPNCRQIYHRAKEKLGPVKKRFPVDPQQQQALLAAFTAASQTGDLTAFIQQLKDDIVVYSDGGGKVSAAIHPIRGIPAVSAFLAGLARKSLVSRDIQPVWVNGGVGVLLFNKDTPTLNSVVVIEADANGIDRIYFVRNPDKLPVV